MTECFRPVAASEISEAHAVYLEVFKWLNAKGIRQWVRALPHQVFIDRQRRGELFAQHIDGRLAAVVTLVREGISYWEAEIGKDQRWWIKSLAVAREHRSAGVGGRVMQESETFVSNTGAVTVFLDCVDMGFLPGYYLRLGYEELGRKEITYPSGNTFPMVLMRKELP